MTIDDGMQIREDNVIDNKDVILSEELTSHFSNTERADIAVGYFFISGLAPIITNLEKVKKIRLLISNTTDKITAETLMEGFQRVEDVKTELDKNSHPNEDKKIDILEAAKHDVQKSLEYMIQTDKERYLVQKLLEMMKNGQIEVRIFPKEKLHAKAYILKMNPEQTTRGIGIVGSSNLSLAGISRNTELNLKTRAPNDYNQLAKWFEGLWKEGIESTKDFEILFEKSWAVKPYSSLDLFHKAIYEEYANMVETRGIIDPVWAKKLPKLFSFQEHAVKRGITMLDDFNGVIIGDVVGLGKTYIGITMLKYLELQNHRSLIICPPALTIMWERFVEEFDVNAKVMSRGKLSKQNYDLSDDGRYANRDLVLIDESHHFRNNTRQYENLKEFMDKKEAGAILLTATPLSNDESDIKNQVMLFHPSNDTDIPAATEMGLNVFFKKVKKQELDLVDLLKDIMIRRMRKDVVAQSGGREDDGREYILLDNEKRYFPNRKLKTLQYDINKTYDNQYRDILKYLAPKSDDNSDGLTLARYSLGSYLQDGYENNELYKDLYKAGKELVGLVRSLLLKRMESSVEAFKTSIDHYINTHNVFLKLLEEGEIPIGKDYKEMFNLGKDDPEFIDDPENMEELRKRIQDVGGSKYKPEAFKIDELRDDIVNDVKKFEHIKILIKRLSPKKDCKLIELQSLLDNEYKGQKVLIFSEFATTVKYLHNNITWDGNRDYTNSSKGDYIECARRFDPDNNPSEKFIPEEKRLSLLIATDVLSEGVNLQAGNVIINYDFHWNPTRLIQRAGRVDRIGSENEIITIHNFLLDPEIEKDLHLQDTVKMKIDKIQRFIGIENKILDENDKISTKNHYMIYDNNTTIFEGKETNILEPTKYEKILLNIKNKNPDLWNNIKSIPNGIRCSDGTKKGGNLLLMCKRGKLHKHYLVKSNGKVISKKPIEFMDILYSNEHIVNDLPDDYDELIAIGWKQFIEDSSQSIVRDSNVIKGAQKYIVERISSIINTLDGNSNDYESLETLRKAFSVPNMKRKVIQELAILKKTNKSDLELNTALDKIYRDYELDTEMKSKKEKPETPIIIYSKYVGNVTD